jgi:hypothetical protein
MAVSVSAVLLGLVAAFKATAAATPPNVLLVVSDDHGFGNVGYHNSTMLTPRMDEMARAGVILEGYYVQPVCSPTRSSLMTGRYTYRLGTQATVIRADVPFGVPLDETFLAQNMRDAGYHTALFGELGDSVRVSDSTFFQACYGPTGRFSLYDGSISHAGREPNTCNGRAQNP